MPLLLTLFAGATRFYRLDRPGGVVFDESHFGKFTGWYTKNEYYFDIHPPFARIVLWAYGKLVGHAPDLCDFENINHQYGPGCHYVHLRTVAAAHSTATCVLMYLLARRWGASVWGGVLASALVIFDMLNTIEGRLVLLDAQLEFWLLAALFVATCWWQRFDEHHEAMEGEGAGAAAGGAGGVDVAAPPPSPAPRLSWLQWLVTPPTPPRAAVVAAAKTPSSSGGVASALSTLSPLQRILWALLVGVVCGNCFSVKMTGLVTPFIVAVESCFAIFLLRRAIPFGDMLIVLAGGAITYTFWFAIHFWLLTRWSKMSEEFMTERYQSTLLGSPNFDPAATWEGFFWTFITHNIRMVVHNANILAPHHWQTRWNEWVLDTRGVAYYGTNMAHGYSDNVYLIGHPLLHWGVVAAIVLFVLLGALYLRLKGEPLLAEDIARIWKPIMAQCAFCLAAYCVNLGPYLAAVERSTFIYHYMPSLMYAQLLVARLVEGLVGRRHVEATTKAIILVLGATWLFFSPWWYAFPMTSEAHDRRRWMPKWN